MSQDEKMIKTLLCLYQEYMTNENILLSSCQSYWDLPYKFWRREVELFLERRGYIFIKEGLFPCLDANRDDMLALKDTFGWNVIGNKPKAKIRKMFIKYLLVKYFFNGLMVNYLKDSHNVWLCDASDEFETFWARQERWILQYIGIEYEKSYPNQVQTYDLGDNLILRPIHSLSFRTMCKSHRQIRIEFLSWINTEWILS